MTRPPTEAPTASLSRRRIGTPRAGGVRNGVLYALICRRPQRLGLALGAVPDKLTAEYWRNRAEEVRVRAEEAVDPYIREVLLRIARDYEHLAKRAEERERPPT